MIGNIILFIAVLLVSGEGVAFATWKLLPDRFQKSNRPTEYFTCSQCDNPGFHRELGWNTVGEPPYGDGIRERRQPFAQVCGAAFGDSFTYGNDVSPDNSYTGQLSQLLGCEVVNYGVGGYSFVQAYDKLKLYKPETNLIILGVYEEMTKRSLSASTLFYAGETNGWAPRPYLFWNGSGVTKIPMPATFDAQTMRAHHELDHFGGASPLRIGFPYLFNVPAQLLRRVTESRTWHHQDVWTARPYAPAFEAWLAETLYPDAVADRVVLLLIPHSGRLQNWRSIISFVENSPVLATKRKCIALPGEALEKAAATTPLLTDTSHFNAIANEIIARSLAQTIQGC